MEGGHSATLSVLPAVSHNACRSDNTHNTRPRSFLSAPSFTTNERSYVHNHIQTNKHSHVHGQPRVDQVLYQQQVAALEVGEVRAGDLDLARAFRPLVGLDAHEVEAELEEGRARAAVRAEVDQRRLELPEEGGAALEHAQQVQRLVAVVLVDVERQLVDAVADQAWLVERLVDWVDIIYSRALLHRRMHSRTVWDQDRFERVLVPSIFERGQGVEMLKSDRSVDRFQWMIGS